MQSHNDFWWAYTRRGSCLVTETFLFVKFFTPVICISRKRNGIRQKRKCSCGKMTFYYLGGNKTRDLFQNLKPLASLSLKYTWGGALSSVDLLKITFLRIFFLYFIMGLFFLDGGGGLYTEPYTCSYTGGLYSES